MYTKLQKIKNLETPKKLLWLDDYRNPLLTKEVNVPDHSSVIWAINHEQFKALILKHGMPDIVSFDHDLAPEHYTPREYWNDYEASKKYQEAQKYKEPTGLDSARWLIYHCQVNKLKFPEYHIHSMNPVGADNIRNLIETFLKG